LPREPDFIPVVGYADDFAVLYATVRMVVSFIDAQVINDARSRLNEWFGDVEEEELQKVLGILS
jgi:uncharacterized membrane protein YkvA (DUF1232 family)